jgi:hypothetical protein
MAIAFFDPAFGLAFFVGRHAPHTGEFPPPVCATVSFDSWRGFHTPPLTLCKQLLCRGLVDFGYLNLELPQEPRGQGSRIYFLSAGKPSKSRRFFYC